MKKNYFKEKSINVGCYFIKEARTSDQKDIIGVINKYDENSQMFSCSVIEPTLTEEEISKKSYAVEEQIITRQFLSGAQIFNPEDFLFFINKIITKYFPNKENRNKNPYFIIVNCFSLWRHNDHKELDKVTVGKYFITNDGKAGQIIDFETLKYYDNFPELRTKYYPGNFSAVFFTPINEEISINNEKVVGGLKRNFDDIKWEHVYEGRIFKRAEEFAAALFELTYPEKIFEYPTNYYDLSKEGQEVVSSNLKYQDNVIKSYLNTIIFNAPVKPEESEEPADTIIHSTPHPFEAKLSNLAGVYFIKENIDKQNYSFHGKILQHYSHSNTFLIQTPKKSNDQIFTFLSPHRFISGDNLSNACLFSNQEEYESALKKLGISNLINNKG